MILLIDNYDSFTYNLVQRIGELDACLDVRVVRNDQVTLEQADAWPVSHVIISPGPCTPLEAGVSCDIIEHFAGRVPVLGVCLGHQSIGHRFGMTVQRHTVLKHGKTSSISHDGKGLFHAIPDPLTVMRYHSLVVTADSVDHERFEITAWTHDDDLKVVMGLRARPGVFGPAPLEGVQFHPESFMTDHGHGMLANFLGQPVPELHQTPATASH